MKKKSIIISILLICSMLLSFTPMIFGNYATATTGAANFLPNTFISGLDTLNETAISTSTANYITSLLNGRYPNRVFPDINTTIQSFNSKLSMVQSNYDQVAVFSKGHRGVPAPGHISLADYSNYVGNQITDYNHIFPLTSSSKNVVTFIWHCETAYPYNTNGVNWDSLGAAGMPYAWTHNSGMNKYGTTGSQVYLGWTSRTYVKVYDYNIKDYTNATVMGGYLIGSPQYEWGINPQCNYANVAGAFWYYMSQGYSVKDSLNEMSKAVYNNPNIAFTSTDLNNWLIVWGNWNMGLPP